MLTKLSIIAAVLALVASADTAAAGPLVETGVFAVDYDSTSKNAGKDKESKKQDDKPKATRPANQSSGSSIEPKQGEADEGGEQTWETELFVHEEQSVPADLVEPRQVVTK